MKNVPIYLILLILFGCNVRTKDNTEIDSFKGELIKKEGTKAIGNINFFISEDEFKKQKEIFLKQLRDTVFITQNQSNGGYKSIKCKLGEYYIKDIKGDFFNDSLYSITIYGDGYSNHSYPQLMPGQYKSLLSILTEKYGKPDENIELPYQPSTSIIGDILAKWNLGFKNLNIFLGYSYESNGDNYHVNFYYYVPEIRDRKEKIEKELKEEQSNTVNKKAIESL